MGLEQCFSNFDAHTYHLGSLSNAVSDGIGLGWDLRFCIPNQLPGDACAAGSLPRAARRGYGDRHQPSGCWDASFRHGARGGVTVRVEKGQR